MTFLAVPVAGESIERLRENIAEAVDLGADLIELRVDLMPEVSDDDIRLLRERPVADVPLILTIRSAAEGGDWDGSEEDRIARMVELGPVVDYVDVESATWLRSAETRHQLRAALDRADHISQRGGREIVEGAAKRRLILSRHDFKGRPKTLHADLLGMIDDARCQVPKLAWRARTLRDNFEAFELMRLSAGAATGCRKPAIVICMGPEGLPSRVLAKKFGAFATFASLSPDRGTAPGQVTLKDMKQCYRWDVLNGRTAVYGVIGDPIEHSLSPRMHNAAFSESGLNAVYLPLKVGPSYEAFKAFMVEVIARPWLDFRGFSVTIPHKQNALRFVRESGGMLDEVVDRVGAVNTITLSSDGAPAGYNTDQAAALEAIASGMGRSVARFAGMTVAVLGAGGAARAVVSGLSAVGADITIYSRTPAKAADLAGAFGCAHAPWDRRAEGAPSLIVNCTSVGMSPDVEAAPMGPEAFQPGQFVFDTIYNPLQTKLLRQALDRGCRAIEGLTMFSLQGRKQFEIWTGAAPPLKFFAETARRRLQRG